MEVVSRRDI